ncbi:MAG: hypothetical protein MK135_07245 [Polyangiaceae bacterium]|nr:hypothetical protein [Polyangiaceae bacterium]
MSSKVTSILISSLLLLHLSGCSDSGGTYIEGGVGSRCEVEEECASGLFCRTDFGDGVCSLECTSGADCPYQAICGEVSLNTGESTNLCLLECSSPDDCDFLGSVCRTTPELGDICQ